MTQNPATALQGYIDGILMILFVAGVIVVVASCLRRCWATLHGEPLPETVCETEDEHRHLVKVGCC